MQKDKQEIIAFGELAVFLLAWTLSVFAALGEYRGRENSGTGHGVAASGSYSNMLDVLE